MNKPWEETWICSEDDEAYVFHEGFGTVAGFSGDCPDDNIQVDQARARLAACAPEAIRMLMAMESPHPGSYLCHWCGEHTKNAKPHRDACPWLALMRKAGVRE